MSETIVQMLEDESGDLWLGTDSGLQRVTPAALPRTANEAARQESAASG